MNNEIQNNLDKLTKELIETLKDFNEYIDRYGDFRKDKYIIDNNSKRIEELEN
jgi:hypothetical protein